MSSVVVVNVHIKPGRMAEAKQGLHDQVIPMWKGCPGYLQSWHINSPDGSRGMGVIVFDTEDSARSALQSLAAIQPPPDAPVSIDSGWEVEYGG